ncbi:LemA family protein [Cohnella panacarvi]|uniref:LemA family protein n=1 Tax=Cohnella panacarvi TaxID=400776 RepID=UPI00047DD50F|nr:LemA family protein [Cohnella panacarvi]
MTWAIIIVVLLALYIIVKYNSLLGMRNRIKETYAAIDIYMQQRYDALLKVAQTVVEYAKYEETTLKEITDQRTMASNARGNDKLRAMDELAGKLSAIVAIGEAYPQLQASDNYLHLQHTIADLEEKLSAGRRTYNANVVAYNTAIGSIPANLISGVLGFKEQDLYEVEVSKKVDFNMKELLQRS